MMCTRLYAWLMNCIPMMNNDDEEEVREEDGREAYEFVFYAVKECKKLCSEKIGGDTVKLKQGRREQVEE